jgi:hypothetical protein
MATQGSLNLQKMNHLTQNYHSISFEFPYLKSNERVKLRIKHFSNRLRVLSLGLIYFIYF